MVEGSVRPGSGRNGALSCFQPGSFGGGSRQRRAPMGQAATQKGSSPWLRRSTQLSHFWATPAVALRDTAP